MIDSIICKYFETGKYDNADELINSLLACSNENICYLIVGLEQKNIEAYGIPQYSSFEDGTINMLHYLRKAGDFGPSFFEVGQHYLGTGKDERAYVKYGENHAKLAEVLGIVEIRQEERKRIYLSELGKALEKRSDKEQEMCYAKLAASVPIVQFAIKQGIEDAQTLEKSMCLYLAETTAKRRRKNTWDMVLMLREG